MVSHTLLLFSLIVIVTIRFFEKQQQLLQAAAAARGLVLEARLATELTETINDRWCGQRWPLFTLLIYLGLGGLVYELHHSLSATPEPSGQSLSAETALALFVVALLALAWLDLRPTSVRGLDWSVDATSVRCGEHICVRVVNLSDQPRLVVAAPMLVKKEGDWATRTIATPGAGGDRWSKGDLWRYAPMFWFLGWSQHLFLLPLPYGICLAGVALAALVIVVVVAGKGIRARLARRRLRTQFYAIDWSSILALAVLGLIMCATTWSRIAPGATLIFPRFRGHPNWRDNAPGVNHGQTKEAT